MRPSVVRAGSDRRGAASAAAAILLSATLLALQPALAGDRALIEHIGYSADYRYFAFEEFGIQDGSGFAYSNVFIIDLESDAWLVGTPIRVRGDSEEETLSSIRSEAAALAQDHVESFSIDVPAETIAMIGDGMPDTDAKSLVFGVPAFQPGAVSDAAELTLSSFETTAASPCLDWFETVPLGYELSAVSAEGTRLIHRDGALPRSRGCPFDYRIHSVVIPFGDGHLGNAVGIISYYPGGFEGPDRRFLAVPLDF